MSIGIYQRVADLREKHRLAERIDQPNYKRRYRAFLAIASNSYIRKYISREATKLLLLKEQADAIAPKLARFEIRRVSWLRGMLAIITCAIIAYGRLLSAITFASPTYKYTAVSGFLIILSTEFITLSRFQRSRSEEFAAWWLFVVMIELNQNTEHWNLSGFRFHIARHLEDAAKALERIPMAVKKVGPGLRSQLIKLGKSKAESIRQLEMLTIVPHSFSLTDLKERVANDLYTLVDGRSYDFARN